MIWLSPLALAWSAGVSITLLFLPVYSSGETVLEANEEASVRLALLIPVVVAGLPVAVPEAARRGAAIACTALMAGFCFLTGFSIGLAYLPAVALLGLSAMAAQKARPRRATRRH